MKISLCLIVRNELQGCREDIPRIPFGAFDEVYAVDGGSTDGTVEYLSSMGIPVHTQPKKGLNAAYVHANEISSGDAVVSFFPKGTIPPDDLLKFRSLLENGCSLVVASRQVKGSSNEEDRHFWRPRKLAVFLLGVLVKLLWHRDRGPWIRDVLHGVKGWRRADFRRMDILDHGLSIDLEMVVRSYRLRMPRCEFPTSESPRAYGESAFRVWPTGKKLLKYLFFELKRSV
jgi:glycosyltransferase involved in cell wall biosynthesis